MILGIIPLLAELKHQIERTELVDLASVLIAVGLFDEPPELRPNAARHVAVDPVAHAHEVEVARRRRGGRIRRRRVDFCKLFLENRIDLRKIFVGL